MRVSLLWNGFADVFSPRRMSASSPAVGAVIWRESSVDGNWQTTKPGSAPPSADSVFNAGLDCAELMAVADSSSAFGADNTT